MLKVDFIITFLINTQSLTEVNFYPTGLLMALENQMYEYSVEKIIGE